MKCLRLEGEQTGLHLQRISPALTVVGCDLYALSEQQVGLLPPLACVHRAIETSPVSRSCG